MFLKAMTEYLPELTDNEKLLVAISIVTALIVIIFLTFLYKVLSRKRYNNQELEAETTPEVDIRKIPIEQLLKLTPEVPKEVIPVNLVEPVTLPEIMKNSTDECDTKEVAITKLDELKLKVENNYDEEPELIFNTNEQLNDLVLSKTSVSINKPDFTETLDLSSITTKMKLDIISDEKNIKTYESEQEESAIISFDELKKVVEIKNQLEQTNIDMDPIDIEEIKAEDIKPIIETKEDELMIDKNEVPIDKYLEVHQKEDIMFDTKGSESAKIVLSDDDFLEKDKVGNHDKKFENSAIISPVFGIQDFDKLDAEEEIEVLDIKVNKNSEDFLQSLKSLRNKL